MSDRVKAPTWFMVVAIVCLVWNLLGVMAFVAQVTMSPEALAELSEAERNLYETLPVWALIAFALAVFGGALGCLLLVLKKAVATPALIISLVGVLVQMSHSFFFSKTFEVYGPGRMVMPIMVVLIAFFLVWLSRLATSKQWLA